MSSEIAISIDNLIKKYLIFNKPSDRLKQALIPKLQKLLGIKPKKFYEEFIALNDISFNVAKGETVGIIGKNGSGKSTLLQLITGTLESSSGNVSVKGRVAALLELGSGFNHEFSGKENVYIYASILGLDQKEIEKRYQSILEFSEIGDFIDQPIKTYSSGMIMRLAFSVIAHVDADILIIDEALSVGDAYFVQKCMRHLRAFMENGTVLFVSHDVGAINNLCDRAIFLEKGKVKATGIPKEVTEKYLENIQAVDTSLVKKRKARGSIAQNTVDKINYRDMRSDIINGSNLRNDIKVFKFNEDSNSYGTNNAKISNVYFQDIDGNRLSWIVGGETVQIVIEGISYTKLESPIVGFQIKDRLGQTIIAENTYIAKLEEKIAMEGGDNFEALFEFNIPALPIGDYSISAAIADGTNENHRQQHWLYDALIFKSTTSYVVHGLVGIPMLNIQFEINNN